MTRMLANGLIPASLYSSIIERAYASRSSLCFSLISRSFGSISRNIFCVLTAFIDTLKRASFTTTTVATIAKPTSPPGKTSIKKTRVLYTGSKKNVCQMKLNIVSAFYRSFKIRASSALRAFLFSPSGNNIYGFLITIIDIIFES